MKALRFLRALPLVSLLFVSPALAAQGTIVGPTVGPHTMADVMGTINAAFLAIQGCNSGSSAPANGPSSAPVSFEMWCDTTTNPVVVKMYDGASWVIVGKLNTSSHIWTPSYQGTDAGTASTATTGTSGHTLGFLDGINTISALWTFSSGDLAAVSPAFTGTPTAPTAAVDTNTTQIATQAAVIQQAASATPLINGTAAVGASTRFARGDHVHPTDTTRAPLASPTFTGVPAAPTAAVDTNTTQLATQAAVLQQAASATPLINGSAAVGTSTRYARGDHVHPTDTTRAPTASPSFTGTVSSAGPVDTTTSAHVQEIANAGTTGTAVNKLAKLTGSPATAVIATTSDTTGNVIGIVIAGAGTTGNAQIAISGQASCVFDGAITSGHYAQVSTTTGGDCHDGGSTFPTSGQILGLIVAATNASPGSTPQAVTLFAPGTVGTSNSSSGTVTEQKNTVTANNGLTLSGNCDNTSSNAVSPCNTAMNLDSAVLEVDSGLGTTVTNNTMMGWGVTSCRITPKYSSRMSVEVTAVIAETATTTFTLVLHYGTGTGPSQGAASAGTQIGTQAFVNGAATMSVPAKVGGIITGLTPGTAVWIDGLVTFTTGDGSISNIGCRAQEVM